MVIFEFDAGKFLVAYMEVGGEKEYYLACACQKIYAPQGAYISLLGLKVQAQFLGGLSKVPMDTRVINVKNHLIRRSILFISWDWEA